MKYAGVAQNWMWAASLLGCLLMFIDITVWFGVAVLGFFPPILLCDIVKFI